MTLPDNTEEKTSPLGYVIFWGTIVLLVVGLALARHYGGAA